MDTNTEQCDSGKGHNDLYVCEKTMRDLAFWVSLSLSPKFELSKN